tara:strand:+ start:161 stop:1333 length:1173 start_codon:yes stop_codon:yes gene_type:complete
MIGSAVSVLNILLIDLSFILLIIYLGNYSFLKNQNLFYFFILYVYLIFNSLISLDFNLGLNRNFGFIRIILFFIAVNFFFNQKLFFNKVIKVWCLTILVVLADVCFEFYFGKNIIGFGGLYGDRIVSFFKDEPIVGGYLNCFYLLIIGFLIDSFKNNKIFSSKIQFFIVLFLIFYLICIILTGERSNTIRASLGLFVFIIYFNEIKTKIKILSLVAVFIFTTILISNSSFLKMRFINQIDSLLNNKNIYFQLYDSGYHVFKNYPIFGVGNKNYRVETCREFRKNEKIEIENYECSTHPHQIYFELLSEHGIFGTVIILFVLYKLIFSKIKNTILTKNNYLKKGCLIYLLFIFIPIIPSGAFFNNYMLTIFIINLSIFYGSDKKLNIFKNY